MWALNWFRSVGGAVSNIFIPADILKGTIVEDENIAANIIEDVVIEAEIIIREGIAAMVNENTLLSSEITEEQKINATIDDC